MKNIERATGTAKTSSVRKMTKPTTDAAKLIIIFFSNFLLKIYFICISVLLIFCIINSFRINFSENYFKSLKSILIGVFGPGMGFVASFFFNSKSIRKIYTQK